MLIIDYHLLRKTRPEIVKAQICVIRSPERQIKCGIAPESPRILKKMVGIRSGKCLAGRKDADIVNDRQCTPEAASAVGAQDNLLQRTVFQCQTRHGLESFAIEPITTEAQNRGKLFAHMKRVFSGNASIVKSLGCLAWIQFLSRDLAHEIFRKPIRRTSQSQRKLVGIIDFILEEDIEES